MKTNSVKTLGAFALMLILGIAFVFIGLKTGKSSIPENYIETEATITRIEEELSASYTSSNGAPEAGDYEYHVFVEYSCNGETYTDVEYGSYNSSMREGGTALLYVNPDNPAEFKGDPSGSTVFVIIGAALAVIGAGALIFTLLQRRGH